MPEYRTANIEAYRAINAVHYAQMQHRRWGRRPMAFVVTMHRNGYTVTPTAVNTRYAIPSKNAKYAHLPRFAWTAWDRGEPVLMMVRYLCGGYSWTARAENTTEFPVCPKCLLADLGYEAVADCLAERRNTP